MKKFLTPQEIEVHYIIPAIRREIAKELKKNGLDQKTIAEKLGVTEAAISQYISGKRASEICFNNKLTSQIKISTKNIIKGEIFVKELQELLKLSKSERLTCKVGKDKGCTPENCEVCFK